MDREGKELTKCTTLKQVTVKVKQTKCNQL